MHPRGFSVLEILIALAMLSSLLIAILLLVLGAPEVLRSAREHHEALLIAEAAIGHMRQRTDHSLSFPSSTISTSSIYTTNLDATLLADERTMRVTATVSWIGRGHQTRHTALSTYLTNYQTESDYPCDVLPRGDWNNVRTSHYALTPGDLLPLDWPHSLAPIDKIAANRSYLAMSSKSTNRGNDPSFFLFTLQGEVPVFKGAAPTSSTTAAVSDMALSSTHAYVASASACSVVSRCGQLRIISFTNPAKPRLVGRLLLSTTTPPYAEDQNGPVPANSIYYKDDLVYLGLEQTSTANGMEFNIIDVQNSEQPLWIGGYRVGRTINEIVVREGVAYLATNARGSTDVLMLDVKTPNAIREVGRVTLPPLQETSRFGYAHTLGISGNELQVGRSYISNADEWVVIDTSSSTLPIQVSKNVGTPLEPLSVRALLIRETLTGVLTQKRFEIWQHDSSTAVHRIENITLPGDGSDAVCMGNDFYTGSNDEGVGMLTHITAL